MGIVCSGQVSDSTDLVSLVKYADEALYKAKAAGRNRIINYEPSP
jgi:PleD family two-component response regulator